MTERTRTIRSSRLSSRRETRDLLQLLFVAEIVSPSTCLWLVSPWVSDIAVLDNRAGELAGLEPDWGPRNIKLSEVLLRLARAGSSIVVAVLSDGRSTEFLRRLASSFYEEGIETQLTTHEEEVLHEKGLAGDDFHLSGSMNLTWRGIELNQEFVTLTTEPQNVADARLAFYDLYGGRLDRPGPQP